MCGLNMCQHACGLSQGMRSRPKPVVWVGVQSASDFGWH